MQHHVNQERAIRRALRNCGSRRFSSGVISLAPTLFMKAIAHFNEHDLSFTFFFLRGVISKTFCRHSVNPKALPAADAPAGASDQPRLRQYVAYGLITPFS